MKIGVYECVGVAVGVFLHQWLHIHPYQFKKLYLKNNWLFDILKILINYLLVKLKIEWKL